MSSENEEVESLWVEQWCAPWGSQPVPWCPGEGFSYGPPTAAFNMY